MRVLQYRVLQLDVEILTKFLVCRVMPQNNKLRALTESWLWSKSLYCTSSLGLWFVWFTLSKKWWIPCSVDWRFRYQNDVPLLLLVTSPSTRCNAVGVVLTWFLLDYCVHKTIHSTLIFFQNITLALNSMLMFLHIIRLYCFTLYLFLFNLKNVIMCYGMSWRKSVVTRTSLWAELMVYIVAL